MLYDSGGRLAAGQSVLNRRLQLLGQPNAVCNGCTGSTQRVQYPPQSNQHCALRVQYHSQIKSALCFKSSVPPSIKSALCFKSSINPQPNQRCALLRVQYYPQSNQRCALLRVQYPPQSNQHCALLRVQYTLSQISTVL